jgi:hypothetical protein
MLFFALLACNCRPYLKNRVCCVWCCCLLPICSMNVLQSPMFLTIWRQTLHAMRWIHIHQQVQPDRSSDWTMQALKRRRLHRTKAHVLACYAPPPPHQVWRLSPRRSKLLACYTYLAAASQLTCSRLRQKANLSGNTQ